MKNTRTIILFTLLVILFGNSLSYSQNDNKKKFQEIVKQKYSEKLNISDSTAEKCMEIFNNSKEKTKKLQKEKRALLQEIENNVEAPDISEKIDRLLEIDFQIDKIKRETVDELKAFLTPKQIAQSIIFQKNLKLFLLKEINKRKKSR